MSSIPVVGVILLCVVCIVRATLTLTTTTELAPSKYSHLLGPEESILLAAMEEAVATKKPDLTSVTALTYSYALRDRMAVNRVRQLNSYYERSDLFTKLGLLDKRSEFNQLMLRIFASVLKQIADKRPTVEPVEFAKTTCASLSNKLELNNVQSRTRNNERQLEVVAQSESTLMGLINLDYFCRLMDYYNYGIYRTNIIRDYKY